MRTQARPNSQLILCPFCQRSKRNFQLTIFQWVLPRIFPRRYHNQCHLSTLPYRPRKYTRKVNNLHLINFNQYDQRRHKLYILQASFRRPSHAFCNAFYTLKGQLQEAIPQPNNKCILFPRRQCLLTKLSTLNQQPPFRFFRSRLRFYKYDRRLQSYHLITILPWVSIPVVVMGTVCGSKKFLLKVYLLISYGPKIPSKVVRPSSLRRLLCSCRLTRTVTRGDCSDIGCGHCDCIGTIFRGRRIDRTRFSDTVI